MRLIFMGTPAFAIPVLDALVSAGDAQIVGVYTPPDRPRGRGRVAEATPVKGRALELGLPVFQPASLRSERAQRELAGLRPEVIVVAAYGRLLPAPVLAAPAHGCLNLHPSLLPRYRGPSPVVTTLLDGDPATGVTLMLLDEGMDSGPVIAQREYVISADETSETLTGALFRLGADLLMESIRPWVQGKLVARPQDESQVTITRKLERSDGEADWQLSAQDLARRRRAYTPWPGLFTRWDGKGLKLLDVSALPAGAHPALPPELPPGRAVPLPERDLPVGIVTADGILGLKLVQIEGRRPAAAGDFIRGYPEFLGAQL